MAKWKVTDRRTGKVIFRGGFWRSLVVGIIAATEKPQ